MMDMFRHDKKDINQEFLKAVRKHKFAAAHKLLKAGADIHARDEEGNTAFHYLTMYYPQDSFFMIVNYSKYNERIREFACHLLFNNLDINAVNNKGRTCLHVFALQLWDEWATARFMRKLLDLGANERLQDHDGATPLHYVAKKTKSENNLIETLDMSALSVRDKDGLYPHDYAALGGHLTLSTSLKIKKAKSENAQTETGIPEQPITLMNEEWLLSAPHEIGHKVDKQVLGYRITETFNFHTRIHSKITFNLETKQDAVSDKGFDEYTDKTIIEDAYAQLIKCGGHAERSSIYGVHIIKKIGVA